jgi:hypothetical protein
MIDFDNRLAAVIPKVVRVVLIVLLGATSASTQARLPEGLAPCEPVKSAPSSWQEIVFEPVTLRTPGGFKRSGRIVGIDHGGLEWVRGPASVRVIRGYFGLRSFEAHTGSRCVAVVRGRQVLLIEQVSKGSVALLAWYPTLAPMFEASSTRTDDLGMLRQILLSAESSPQAR